MVDYKCFFCGKQLTDKNIKARFSCPNCGAKIFFKPRAAVKKIKAV
jgi:DNA-directed RNA polymerase subunit RPC12/RpoP